MESARKPKTLDNCLIILFSTKMYLLSFEEERGKRMMKPNLMMINGLNYPYREKNRPLIQILSEITILSAFPFRNTKGI